MCQRASSRNRFVPARLATIWGGDSAEEGRTTTWLNVLPLSVETLSMTASPAVGVAPDYINVAGRAQGQTRLLHGVNGLRVITLDYVRPRGARVAMNWMWTIVGVSLFALGTVVVFTFNACTWPGTHIPGCP